MNQEHTLFLIYQKIEVFPNLLADKGLGGIMLRFKNWHIVGAQLMLTFSLSEGGKCYTFILILLSDFETYVGFNLVE